MTELDITVNDGLRLSELYGQLADLQYKMDNIGLYIDDQKLRATITLLVIAAFIGFCLSVLVMPGFYRHAYREDRILALAVMGGFILIVAVVWWFWMGHIDTYAVYNLECDMSRVQGEIDGILARYGGDGA